MSDDAVKSKTVFFLLFLLLLVLFSAVAGAQPAFQVDDLNTTRPGGMTEGVYDSPALPPWERPSFSGPPTGSTASSPGGPMAPRPAPA